MSNEIKADISLDLKGVACPMPVIKVSQQIKKMQIGQIIAAETTDPGAHADFPAWAKTTGNEIVSIDKKDSVTVFYIKKLK